MSNWDYAQGPPASTYKFSNVEDIKTHSSYLYNERLAILFYVLDMRSIELNTHYEMHDLLQVRAILYQIYKNIRMLIRANPVARSVLNLETKDAGIYVTDVAVAVIDRMIEYCHVYGWSSRKIYIITNELNYLEMMIKDTLQYFQYFIKPTFKQKPDIEFATETYKEMADERTVDELRELVGKKHRIDFEALGVVKGNQGRVEYTPQMDNITDDMLIEEDTRYNSMDNEDDVVDFSDADKIDGLDYDKKEEKEEEDEIK